MKYPLPALGAGGERRKKFSVFRDDLAAFETVAQELGLEPRADGDGYARHPLSYLVEAADDIAYLIADLDDGLDAQILRIEEAEPLLLAIVPGEEVPSLSRLTDPSDRFGYLRAKAIGTLTDQAVKAFIGDHDNILAGRRDLKAPLLDDVESTPHLREIRTISRERLYDLQRNLEAEVAGFEAVHGLLAHLRRRLARQGRGRARKKGGAQARTRLQGSREAGHLEPVCLAAGDHRPDRQHDRRRDAGDVPAAEGDGVATIMRMEVQMQADDRRWVRSFGLFILTLLFAGAATTWWGAHWQQVLQWLHVGRPVRTALLALPATLLLALGLISAYVLITPPPFLVRWFGREDWEEGRIALSSVAIFVTATIVGAANFADDLVDKHQEIGSPKLLEFTSAGEIAFLSLGYGLVAVMIFVVWLYHHGLPLASIRATKEME